MIQENYELYEKSGVVGSGRIWHDGSTGVV